MLETRPTFPEHHNSILTKKQTNKTYYNIQWILLARHDALSRKLDHNKQGFFFFVYLLVVAALGEELRGRERPGEES